MTLGNSRKEKEKKNAKNLSAYLVMKTPSLTLWEIQNVYKDKENSIFCVPAPRPGDIVPSFSSSLWTSFFWLISLQCPFFSCSQLPTATLRHHTTLPGNGSEETSNKFFLQNISTIALLYAEFEGASLTPADIQSILNFLCQVFVFRSPYLHVSELRCSAEE